MPCETEASTANDMVGVRSAATTSAMQVCARSNNAGGEEWGGRHALGLRRRRELPSERLMPCCRLLALLQYQAGCAGSGNGPELFQESIQLFAQQGWQAGWLCDSFWGGFKADVMRAQRKFW